MRREGVRYNIRSNQTLKYCRQCLDNSHCDRDHPNKKLFNMWGNVGTPDVVVITRFTKKPLFTCRHSHGCKRCSHTAQPYDKAVKKAKGARKEGRKFYNDATDINFIRF
jgi:hypothetical protein